MVRLPYFFFFKPNLFIVHEPPFSHGQITAFLCKEPVCPGKYGVCRYDRTFVYRVERRTVPLRKNNHARGQNVDGLEVIRVNVRR